MRSESVLLGPVYTGPVPDWVQIGLAFTRDLLEPVRCGPLEKRPKYGPGLV